MAVCRQALAYRHAMADLAFVEQGLGSFPIALGSTDAGLLERLAGVARGEEIPALALTEAGAGSDLSGVATRAERDGDDFVLTGAKTYITNIGVADFYTVLARTSGEPGERDGLTMFFVEHGAQGLSTRGFQVMAPHPIGELFLDGVRVPAAHALGEIGAGMDLALANLARFRITVAAAANGFARRALAESVAHLSHREQFGRPLSSFQGLRFDLAEMDTRLRAAELLTDRGRRGGGRGGGRDGRGGAGQALLHGERLLGLRPRRAAPRRRRGAGGLGGGAAVSGTPGPCGSTRGRARSRSSCWRSTCCEHTPAPETGSEGLMPGYQRMLFVCLNDRGDEHPRGSCARAGGDEVLDRLRAGLHERGLKGRGAGGGDALPRAVRPRAGGRLPAGGGLVREGARLGTWIELIDRPRAGWGGGGGAGALARRSSIFVPREERAAASDPAPRGRGPRGAQGGVRSSSRRSGRLTLDPRPLTPAQRRPARGESLLGLQLAHRPGPRGPRSPGRSARRETGQPAQRARFLDPGAGY